MAGAAGMSLGRTIGDWLDDTIEGAQFVALKMAEAKAQPRVVMREMQAMLQGTREEVDSVVEAMRKGGKTGATRSSRASGLASPPSSNTGGKVPRGGAK